MFKRARISRRALPPSTNIRQFHLAADGNLYAGVRRADVTTSGVVASGRVIRWVSNPASPLYPFQFEEVAAFSTGNLRISRIQWSALGHDLACA
jgi:hypothetical protein